MKLSALTQAELITLQTQFASRDEAIIAMTELLDQQGKLHDKAAYLQAVMDREALAPTALGEGFAVPHGKSDAVKEACYAVATLKSDMPWPGIDGDEPVQQIFLLAIPTEQAGSTHLQLLAELSTTLVDDAVREAVMKATDAAQFMRILDGEVDAQAPAQPIVAIAEDAPTIVCVTACPAGIAHTYMAAEYLEKAGKKLGIHVHVERQGANGIDGRLSAEAINKATAVVFAAEVAIKEVERFAGIPAIKTPVAEPIRQAERILNDAIEAGKAGRSEATQVETPTETKVSVKTELKQALLSGISFSVPLIVAGGSILAIAVLLSQMLGLQELYNTQGSWLNMYRQLGGGLLGMLMVPVLAAYTAYSLADKPALGPGFAAGLAANLIGAGFLGGVVGGLIAGYLMRWVKTYVRLSPQFNGFLTFYLYPVLGTLIAGSLMLFVVGKPVAWLNNGLTEWLNSLNGTNALLLGAIIGLFVSFDLGGPVNKASYAFCLGAMANGVYEPYAIFGSVKMVSGFTVTAATMLAPRLFKSFEVETGKSTWLLALAGITEGAIPMAIEDPIRVIGSLLVGSAVTGAIVGAASIGLSTPGAGIFSMFLMDGGSMMDGVIWLVAAIVGAAISTCTLLLWRGYSVRKGTYVLEAAA